MSENKSRDAQESFVFLLFFCTNNNNLKKKLKLLSLSLDRSQDRGEGLESGGNKHAFYDDQI